MQSVMTSEAAEEERVSCSLGVFGFSDVELGHVPLKVPIGYF